MSEFILTATDANFQDTVKNVTDKPVFVDFWAPWCGPCRMMSPIVDQLADELADVKVCKVDIDQAEALATEYGVEVVPTFIVFENGEAVKSVSGVMPKPVILDMLK